MKKILTLSIALILVAGIVSVAKSATIDSVYSYRATDYSKDRHIVQSSDGTIVVVYRSWSTATTDLRAKKSINNGVDWYKLDGTSGYTVLSGDSYIDNYDFSICIDEDDNIYVTYLQNNDVFFRKLTAQAGTWTTWTVGDRKTVDATNDNAYPTITYQESTGRAWVAYGQDDGGTNAWLRAKWAVDPFTTWTLTTVTTGGTYDNRYAPALVIRDGNPYIVYTYYNSPYDLRYSVWSGSWNGGIINDIDAKPYYAFSVTLITTTVHVVWFRDGTLRHTYSYNGTTNWTTSLLSVSDSGYLEDKECSLTTDWDTDDAELWCYKSVYFQDPTNEFDDWDIKRRKWNGSSWESWVTVYSSGEVERFTTTPFVSRGHVPVAYTYGHTSNYDVEFDFSVILDETSPEAIDDLAGTCPTGDVVLTWSTPGDDGGSGTLPEMSGYRLDYSSVTKTWDKDDYEVWIPTYGVAPPTGVSHTVASLQDDTTWYFRIWTRDEVPNWSGDSNLATVWIPPPSQTYNWDGGGAEGDWDDANNWSGATGYPNAATDKAIINTGSESINTGAVLTIGQLELGSDYSGTLTLGGNLTLDDSGPWDADLTISNANATLDLAGKNLTLESGSTFSNDGTLKLQGGETLSNFTNDTNSGTVEYVGDGASAGDYTIKAFTGTDYYHLTINSTLGVTDIFRLPTSNLIVAGNYTLTAGTFNTNDDTTDRNLSVTGNVEIVGTFTANSSTITVSGNWDSYDGVFNYGTSTVDLADTGTSTLTGSCTFYVLVSTTSTKTVQVSSDTVIDVTNHLNFENITLRSTSNGATWYLNLSGTQDVSGVDVRDSNASGSTDTIIAFTSTDSGNNTEWDFGPPEAITDLTGECDSGTGDVTLSWSTPGDDYNWQNTLVDGSKYRIDYSSYSIAWSTSTFDLDISTHSVAPHTQVSRTITGLTADTTWYFRIWTADEVPLWSGLSNGATVWVEVIVATVTVSAHTSGDPDVPPIYTQSTGNCLGTFRFNGTGTITELTITEYGTCDADGELENVKLYKDNGDGNWESGPDTQLGSTTDFDVSDKATFSFSLAASTYCYVHVILDVKSTADSGGTVGIKLYQDDIVCTSTTTASSWPVQLETSMIIGETTLPFFDEFRSQNSTDVWITTSEWNDVLTPNTKVRIQDTGSGLRIGSQEVSPDTHTVLLMHLNDNTTDYSGHGNNGTRQGEVGWISTDTWKTGVVDPENILYFDGEDDYINCGNSSSLNTPNATISAWIRLDPSFNIRNIVARDNHVDVLRDFQFRANGDDTLRFIVFVGNTVYYADSTASIPEDGTWTHVAGTYDGETIRCYINGILDGTDTSPSGNMDNDGGYLSIGARITSATPTFSEPFKGLIDEVRVLDRVLTADEIAADYYSGLFKYSKDGGGTWYSISGSTVAWSTGTVTGENGSTEYETIYASNVPFNQYSGTQNKIKFLVSDTNGNIAESSPYIVKIGSITVSAYTDGDPDVPPIYTQSTDNCLGTFRFNGTGTITELTITEYGTCDADGELENVKLYKDNGDGNWESGPDTQLGSTTDFDVSDKATFSFSLAASTYCYVHVILDVKSTADSGGTVGIKLYQDDIVCTSTTTASSWPVQLETSMIIGETTLPFFDEFRSQNSTDVWITTSEWNDDSTPNTKVRIQDTGSGLRIGSQEVSPDTHTVLLMHLNDNTTDYSGHNNHGTREGEVGWISTDTWKTGVVDPEDILYFDGDGDYVNVSSLDWTPTIFSVVWWHYPLTRTDYNQRIKATGGWGAFFFHTTADGSVYVGTDVDNRFTPTDLPANTVELNKWQQFTYTYDGTQGRFYKNGVLLAGPKNQISPTAWGGFQIGNDSITTINGLIDEVRILDRALTADEIAADYYSGLFKYSTNGGSTWNPTNAWSTGTVTGVNGSTSYETIHASNVPFNQYSETENKIKFLVSDTNGNIAYSSEYTVMIGSITVSAYTDGDPDVPPSTVGQGTTGNCLGTFKFDGVGTITQLTITEYGTCDADGELENVELFKDDGDGDWESGQDTTLLGSTTDFNSSDEATFSFSLAASTYCYVHVILDVKSTADSGGTVGIKLYQNDIVCTSTTTASSWPVQLGTSTIKDDTAPAAITDLTGECDSGSGDVILSWSTPGDDGWIGTLVSGSKYRIDYSSYSIAWSTENYKVDIPTHSVAPHTQVSRTVTGLTGGTTWYFRIWTADEIPLWSGLSNGCTVWVNPILSVSISTDTYNFGTIDCGTSTVSGNIITVTNDSNVTETYSIKCSSTTKWTPENTPGPNEFTLQSAFHSSEPADSDLVWETDDILTESLQTCTTAVFSIDGTKHGKEVPPFNANTRKLWYRLKTPLSTSTTDQQNIIITISAEQSP